MYKRYKLVKCDCCENKIAIIKTPPIYKENAEILSKQLTSCLVFKDDYDLVFDKNHLIEVRYTYANKSELRDHKWICKVIETLANQVFNSQKKATHENTTEDIA